MDRKKGKWKYFIEIQFPKVLCLKVGLLYKICISHTNFPILKFLCFQRRGFISLHFNYTAIVVRRLCHNIQVSETSSTFFSSIKRVRASNFKHFWVSSTIEHPDFELQASRASNFKYKIIFKFTFWKVCLLWIWILTISDGSQ